MKLPDNFRNAFPATVIEVKEGIGTPEDMARIVYYVYNHNTEQLIGKIDPSCL